MKKTFLTRRNALFTGGLSLGTYALIGVCLLLLLRLLAPNIFWQLFTPVFRLSDSLVAESRGLFSHFGDTATLTRENEMLLDENTRLILENKTLTQEREALLGLTSDTPGVYAGVVARPPESPYDTLVLAAGTRAGVSIGMGVFAEGSTPVGVISSVTADFARATLFSAPGVSTNGWVGSKNFPITLTGAGAGVLSATAPRSLGISIGDSVSVSGPGMQAIGIVTRVDSDPTSPSVTLRITPAINLFSISWVVVRDTGLLSPL